MFTFLPFRARPRMADVYSLDAISHSRTTVATYLFTCGIIDIEAEPIGHPLPVAIDW